MGREKGLLEVPYTIVDTQIGQIIFEDRKESNPCSLCAKMRKGAFNEKAKELGCNKVAYAHHKDDVVETMLLSFLNLMLIDVYKRQHYPRPSVPS